MNLDEHYRAYIACLNDRRWHDLGHFVDDDVRYNGEKIGACGYRKMLEADVSLIPDLRFVIDLLVVDASHVAARLVFNCSPQGRFLGLEADGRRITFSENVLYTFCDGRISDVWSIIDKAAVERELRGESAPAPGDRSV
ncbi:hypothetical protein K0038_01133 [Pseudomonas syringae]|uniref:ester cyclase n=1 Tax=Pseudomonas syringae TaxID=317 RepID=UPI001CA896A2|nr:ester cyclase [Pseudomonas syringae]MCI3944127.1 hypothetical protein [Pseudomonas syringae]